MNKQKMSLTQQIHSLHLKNSLRRNVIRSLVCGPFPLASTCKYWIYVIDDIGLFPTLSNIKKIKSNLWKNKISEKIIIRKIRATNNKHSSHGKWYKKDIEKWGKQKAKKWIMKSIRKVQRRNKDNKILYFYF